MTYRLEWSGAWVQLGARTSIGGQATVAGQDMSWGFGSSDLAIHGVELFVTVGDRTMHSADQTRTWSAVVPAVQPTSQWLAAWSAADLTDDGSKTFFGSSFRAIRVGGTPPIPPGAVPEGATVESHTVVILLDADGNPATATETISGRRPASQGGQRFDLTLTIVIKAIGLPQQTITLPT